MVEGKERKGKDMEEQDKGVWGRSDEISGKIMNLSEA